MNIKYKGFTYLEDKEYEPELIRINHYAVDSSGNKVSLDYTQWREMTETAFKALVDLGLIGRKDPIMPWTEETLLSFKASKRTKLSEL